MSDETTFRGVDRSKWSLQDFLLEGESITWEAQAARVRQSRDPFVVSEVHDHFVIWYLSLKKWFQEQGYYDTKHPAFRAASSLSVAHETPLLAGSAMQISGMGYGDPLSQKSQALLTQIRRDTNNILKVIRRILSPKVVKEVATAKEKIVIHVDPTRGLFCVIKEREVFYPRLLPSSKSFKTLLYLTEKNTPVHVSELATRIKQETKITTRSIKALNKNARRHFNIKKDLILDAENGFYYLNIDHFEFL